MPYLFVVCKKCGNADLLPGSHFSFICKICSKEIDLYEIDFAYLKEKETDNAGDTKLVFERSGNPVIKV